MKKPSKLTPLQRLAVREILAQARRENWPAGQRLAKVALAAQIGTSHNPVEGALAYLARIGVARHEPDRGYFLAKPAQELAGVADEASAADDPLYLRIAEARLAHLLADVVTEAELIRRYRTTRAAVRKALLRIQQEGWVERRAGHGWEFLPIIDSQEAYDESYEIRRALEPSAIVSAKFRPDAGELATLRKQQEFIAKTGYDTMTAMELTDLNARFHETIASWSGNRFILQTIRRLNQLRRLIEYKRTATGQRRARKTQAEDHLAIIAAIERGDYLTAASLVRAHLEDPRREKIRPDVLESTEPPEVTRPAARRPHRVAQGKP
jgi:DNA-binding GntR family transcriptional regulator